MFGITFSDNGSYFSNLEDYINLLIYFYENGQSVITSLWENSYNNRERIQG